jgi:hypothetical protein
LRSTLVVSEIAIALVLLTASSLLLRSFEKTRSIDLGYRPEHVITASYSLPQKQYEKQAQVDTFNRELLRRLHELPGVTATGLTSQLPSGGVKQYLDFRSGRVYNKGADLNLATWSQVIENFLPAIGIPLRGRVFTEADRHGWQLLLIVKSQVGATLLAWSGGDSIRSLASPTDLNGNGGFLVLRRLCHRSR